MLLDIKRRSKPCLVKHLASKSSVGSSSAGSPPGLSKSDSQTRELSSEKSLWSPPSFLNICCGVFS